MKVPYAEVLEMDEDEPIELPKEHGIELTRMTFDDLQDAAGDVCTKRDFESANGDDEDEEEEEEKKKEKDEEDEDDDDDDDDDGAIQIGEVGLTERRISRRPPPEGIRTPARSRAGYDFAPRTLSRIDPAIRARVGIAIDEDSAGVIRTIGLASVNRVRA